MREQGENPNSVYVSFDLLEEIFLRLPLKSVLKFKILSKQWRSILESRRFTERRVCLQKNRKILATCNCKYGDRPCLLPESRFEGDEEIVYVPYDNTLPSMTCDGLICIPEPDWITVFNPSTRQYRRFPSGPGPVSSSLNFIPPHLREPWASFFPGDRAMGFGRDIVTGCLKVVRMCSDPVEECEVLELGTCEWRKLTPPTYMVDERRKSVCVNGSLYWLKFWRGNHILALNLHTEKFHNVSFPDTWLVWDAQLLNLENRLALVKTRGSDKWKLQIWIMEAEEEIWSRTHSINLASLTINSLESNLFTPLTVSKLGDVVFCDNHKRLFKYCRETHEIRCLSSDICAISPYIENLVPLKSEAGHHPYMDNITSRCKLLWEHPEPGSGIFKYFKGVRFGVSDILFNTLVIGIELVIFLWLH